MKNLMDQTERSDVSKAGIVQGAANTRLFLRRLSHLKEKLDSELEPMKISRSKQDQAPRSGKRILEEERNQESSILVPIDSQQALLYAMQNSQRGLLEQ